MIFDFVGVLKQLVGKQPTLVQSACSRSVERLPGFGGWLVRAEGFPGIRFSGLGFRV